MSQYGNIFSDCLSSLVNRKSFASIMASPSLGTGLWICRASRLGGCDWGFGWSLRAGLDPKTTRLMNRCIECIRPKRLRLRQPRRGASSNELRVLFATITMTVRTRRWSKECPQPFTERADAAIEAGCPNCDTVELGLRAVSPKAVTYAGADESESLVEPSMASVWASGQSVPASMRFISGVILLAFWWTPIQEACVQLDGPVEWKQQLGRCLTKTAGAAEIASRPSGGSAARFGAGAPHRSAPPPEGRSPARN